MTSKMIRLNVVVLVLGLMIHGGANQAAAQLENSAWQSHYGQPQGPAYQAQIQFQGSQGSYDVQGWKGQFSSVTYYRDQNTGAVNAITGNWTFADGNKGWFQFNLSPDGQSFTGTFGYGAFGSPTSGYWNGKRIGEPVPAVGASAEGREDLTRVVVPDDEEAALLVLKEWLGKRGFEVEAPKGFLVMRREGVPMNLIPIVNKGELDLIRVSAFYRPKEEYKGSKEFEQLAVQLNRSQHFLQVYVDDNGNLAAASNLTFYDELSAKVFDSFEELFIEVFKKYVLADEARKMLK